MPDFTQRDCNLKAPVIHPLHGDIEPVLAQWRLVLVHRFDDFPSGNFCMADIRSKPCTSFLRIHKRECKWPDIAPKHEDSYSWSRILNDPSRFIHRASLLPKLSDFWFDLHQSLAHQRYAKFLDISMGMPADFANLAASRSWHISSPKFAQLRYYNLKGWDRIEGSPKLRWNGVSPRRRHTEKNLSDQVIKSKYNSMEIWCQRKRCRQARQRHLVFSRGYGVFMKVCTKNFYNI